MVATAECVGCGKRRKLSGIGYCRTCLSRALRELDGTTERFEEFWSIVVRKDGKVPSKKLWARLGLDSQADQVIAYFQRNRKDWQEKVKAGEKNFIPMPATVLNQRRWEDEVDSGGETKQKRKTFL